MGGTGGISTGLPSKNERAMDESEKGRRMDESRTEEWDVKTKEGRRYR
jgi:hypothetical protein